MALACCKEIFREQKVGPKHDSLKKALSNLKATTHSIHLCHGKIIAD